MAPTTSNSPDEQLQYVMLVMANTDPSKPNWNQVAAEAGIASANTAQKKFKKIVEQTGYNLVNNAIVKPNGSDSPATPKAAQVKKVSTPQSKKRKVKAEETEEEEQE